MRWNNAFWKIISSYYLGEKNIKACAHFWRSRMADLRLGPLGPGPESPKFEGVQNLFTIDTHRDTDLYIY